MDHSNHLRILIVEDGNWFQALLQNILDAKAGYRIAGCASGENAIKVLEQKNFDLVILDDTIPASSGLKLLQWRHDQQPDIPVILLTAAASSEMATAAKKFGDFDYLNKQRLEIDHFPILVNDIRERRLARQARQAQNGAEPARQRELMARLRTATEAVTLSVNTSLSILLSEAKEYENYFSDLPETGPAPPSRDVSQAFREFNHHVEAVVAGVRSLVALTNLVFSKYAGNGDHAEISRELEEALKRLNQTETYCKF